MILDPLRDIQQDPPDAHCIRCEGELWGVDAEDDGSGYVMCHECREDISDMDSSKCISNEVLEAMEAELKKYLSVNLCDEVWNKMVSMFRVKDDSL